MSNKSVRTFGERSSEYSQVFDTSKSMLLEAGYGTNADIILRATRNIYLVPEEANIFASDSSIREVVTDDTDGSSAVNISYLMNHTSIYGFTSYYMRYYSSGITMPSNYTTYLTPPMSITSTAPLAIFTIYLMGKSTSIVNYFSMKIETSGYLDGSSNFHFYYDIDGTTVKSTTTEFSRASGYDYDLVEYQNGFKIQVIADSNGETTTWSAVIVRSSLLNT